MKTKRPLLLRFIAPAAALLTLSGCHLFHRAAPQVVTALNPIRVASAAPLPLDLNTVQPNEAGQVPILEYHDLVIGNKFKDYQYPAAEFRKDMEWLYAHHYRPISLSDYAQGRIDCPAGTSPVILTFDDALKGQFHYMGDGKIDPDSAVGILDALHAQHPDWPLKGTFFVLTDQDPRMPPPFYQKDSAQAKMEYLVREGYEIGNHTVHHRLGMKHWSDAQVEAEFAGGVVGIHKYLPSYDVQTLALPFGVFPKNHKLLVSGQSGGVTYHNICALDAGWYPAASPLGKKDLMGRHFTAYRLPRIIPANAKVRPGGLNTIRYWLTTLEKDKSEKFISDGDPNTYTVSSIAKSEIDPARLKAGHFHLRTYTGTQLLASN